ncbi:MAG: glycosyltransferase [Deltaproteobacteria bacterium]|nr:glycosyltransferase [Deltaproteobacteria bacterium]
MISVIVSFYERLSHLKCCLDALSLCSNDFDEVVIADDGSNEEVVRSLEEYISKYDFEIRHVWQEKRGFRLAASRNNGIREARGDYLIFLDCDLVVLHDTIKCHLKAARPKRFLAGNCKYLTEIQTNTVFRNKISPDLLDTLYRKLPEENIIRDHRKFIKHVILSTLYLRSKKKQTLGGHFSIHREDIENVNGFDENFIGWGGEDENLGIRLVTAGSRGRSVIRKARCLHLWHSKEIGDKGWKEGPNIGYFKRSHIPFYCENGLNQKVRT